MQQTELERKESKMSDMLSKIKNIKVKPADVTVTAVVLLLVCLVIVPSVVKCVANRNKSACESHMNKIVKTLGTELTKETESGGSYLHELIMNGNYQKLMNNINVKTGDSGKFPSSDYYIRPGDEKLSVVCKKHNDIVAKELSFSVMRNVSVDIAPRPTFAERIVYLSVSGPDTYYQNDSLDPSDPSRMVFVGEDADKAIQNLKVKAVYIGGAEEELPRVKYTVTSDGLDMTKPGQALIIVKSNPTSLWDNSAYAPFLIDVIGEEDIAPLIADGGINGKYELAAWDWRDFVEEASMEDGGKTFGASIVRSGGAYYYYPNGMRIVNSNENSNPFDYALDTDDEKKSAYCIKFDPDSVILTDADNDKIHNGSMKVENELVYIWQDKPAKELPAGWIRVYCELKKY